MILVVLAGNLGVSGSVAQRILPVRASITRPLAAVIEIGWASTASSKNAAARGKRREFGTKPGFSLPVARLQNCPLEAELATTAVNLA